MAFYSYTPATATALIIASLFLMIVGIAFCFWGKKIIESFAFIIFGILGGILGLILGIIITTFFGIEGTVALAIILVLCLICIILGAVLSKFFLRFIVVFYCAINAFLFVWVITSGMTKSDYIPIIAGAVAGIVVAIVLKMLFEKLLAAISAFFGAMLIGMAVLMITQFVASQFFDFEFLGMYYYILLGVVLGIIIVLGFAGTMKQLKGKSAPPPPRRRQPPPRRRR